MPNLIGFIVYGVAVSLCAALLIARPTAWPFWVLEVFLVAGLLKQIDGGE